MPDNSIAATAELKLNGRIYQLPLVQGTMGDKAIDISGLLQETGYITLDSGYKNTGACTSAITYLDGKNGVLRYRGYAIEDLANHCIFVEVAYLLLHGKLPNEDGAQGVQGPARPLCPHP